MAGKKQDTVLKFRFYIDAKGEHRWQLIHQNGNIMADSGEGYSRKIDCVEAVATIQWYARTASRSFAKRKLA